MLENILFCGYNNGMERLLEILGTLAVLYVVYQLSLARWDYASSTKREHRKTQIKEEGLSTRFYFMHPRTQFLFTLLSGGLFALYWIYQQWKQILTGFKRLDGSQLQGGALVRTIGAVWSFFALGNLINRTCEYMRKETSWPSWLWGTLWLGSLALLCCPVNYRWRIGAYVVFCLIPTVYQRRLNTLTHKHISAFPRAVEIVVTLLGMACVCVAVWWYKR